MLIGYGGYSLAFTIAASNSGTSAFLTSSAALNDGREGIACSMSFNSAGSQTTAYYTELTVTITSSLDASPSLGVVGICNVTGLPVGTLITVLDSTGSQTLSSQRVAAGVGLSLCAWSFPLTGGGSTPAGTVFKIRIFNNVNSSASITPGTTFSFGEIFIGRVIGLKTLVQPSSGSAPVKSIQDATAWQRMSGGQYYQTLRKPIEIKQVQMGPFSVSDVGSATVSSITSGGNPNNKISLAWLRNYLSTTQVLAVCDYPTAGFVTPTTKIMGVCYDVNFMQENWMLARCTNMGDFGMDAPPYQSWNPQFMQAY